MLGFDLSEEESLTHPGVATTNVYCNYLCLRADAARRFAERPVRTRKRISEFERFVLAIAPGEVGRLVLTEDETLRSFKSRIERAAERLNIFLAVWTVEGAVYFRLVDSNSSDRPSGT